MLRKRESTKTTPTETSTGAFEAMIPIHTKSETVAQNSNVTLEELAIYVEGGIARNKRRSRTVQWINEFYPYPWIPFGVWVGSHGIAGLPIMERLLLLVVVCMSMRNAVFNVVFARWVRKSLPTERSAVRRLLAMDDVRTVAPLIDSLEWTEDRILELELWKALSRLLPRLTETEVQRLGEERHGFLAASMKSWDYRSGNMGNQPLVGILHVMACLGQRSIRTKDFRGQTSSVSLLPLLKRWASGDKLGQDPAVQEAANACREAIEQKLALARSGEQLLRASELPPPASENLLRPTQGTSSIASQELLRPTDPD